MKAGFVNIVGNPNVGKSTLMNALVGERLSIITNKVQTTRHRIMGIVNGEDYQIVYSDTPGVLQAASPLHEKMMAFALSALTDADVLLYVTEANDVSDKNNDFLNKVQAFAEHNPKATVFVCINKIDLLTEETLNTLYDYWNKVLPTAQIIPISAKHKFGVKELLQHIIAVLPEGEPFFPQDQLTDKSERFFVEEIIREKILLSYQKEIPYSVQVEVNTFRDEPKRNGSPCTHISATIYCERESQKGILIGRDGMALKKVGTLARKDIEDFLQRAVFLLLEVKVDPDWRSNDKRLKHYGYDPA